MKKALVFILGLSLLVSCGEQVVDKTNTLEKFRLNNYEMILDAKAKFGNIRFKIPSCFLRYWSKSTIRQYSFERHTRTFNAYFSIERFKESERDLPFLANEIMTSDMLNLFHDAYVKKRIETEWTGISSLKKNLPKKVKFPGLIQVVKDLGSPNGQYYVIATLKVKKEYYIFQWTTQREMLGYTYDDFESVLATVRIIK